MSKGSRGAALSSIGEGLMGISGKLLDIDEARRKEKLLAEKAKRKSEEEAPERALRQRILSSQASVAGITEEQTKREEEAKLKIIEIEKMLQDPVVAEKFKGIIKQGLDIANKQNAAAAPAMGSDIPGTAPVTTQPIPKLMGSNPADLGTIGTPPKPGMNVPSLLDIPGQQPAQQTTQQQTQQPSQAEMVPPEKSYEEKWLEATRGIGLDMTGGDVGVRRKQYEDDLKTEKGSSLGKSSVAAAFEFTQQHPELVEKTKSVIRSLRNQGIYSNDLLNNLETMADSDVRQTNSTISGVLGFTEKTKRTIDETLPGKVRTAAETTAASTRAGIETQASLADVSAGTAGTIAEAKKTGTTKGLERVSEAEVNGITGLQEAVATLDGAIDTFNKDYVGVFKGRFKNMEEAIGSIGADPAVFRSNATRFQNALIKANAGAAVSDQEMKRMVSETFDFKLKPDTYMAKMKNNLAYVKLKNDLRIKTLGSTGRDISNFKIYNVDTEDYNKKQKTLDADSGPADLDYDPATGTFARRKK
jgi:hypothetical protein